MKTIYKTLIISVIIFTSTFFSSQANETRLTDVNTSFPNLNTAVTLKAEQKVPGEAPLGDGAWILLTLAMAYGVHTFQFHRKQHAEGKKEK